MRTHMTKLCSTFLGLLVISSFGCGGSSDKGTGCDGPCPTDGGGKLDGAQILHDTALPTPDQAPGVDQAKIDGSAVEVSVDLGTVKLDAADALPDVPADRPADLPWGPEVESKKDAPSPQPDQAVKKDVAPGKDTVPAIDTRGIDGVRLDSSPVLDTSGPEVDTAPAPDTADAMPDQGPDIVKNDADPTLPAVWPDQPAYSPNQTMTITYANANPEGWIGIYTPNALDSQYMQGWEYWDYTDDQSGAGTISLLAPSSTGTYELRMFANSADPYNKIATFPFIVQ